MDLNTLIILDKIASSGSFTAAARALGMSNTNVSLKIRQLEQELGQVLFTRSTRKVMITEFGQKVQELSAPIARIKEEIKELAEGASREPSGKIRITAAFDVAMHLLREIIPQFLERYPKISVDVDMDNSLVDIIEGGFDFAVRATRKPLPDSTAVAVKLGETSTYFFASSKSRYADISSFEELRQCPILHIEGKDARVVNGEQAEVIQVNTQISVNDMSGIKQAVMGGMGIGLLPEIVCSDAASKKALKRILPEWSFAKSTFYAICPGKSSLTLKNRVFLEFLKEKFYA